MVDVTKNCFSTAASQCEEDASETSASPLIGLHAPLPGRRLPFEVIINLTFLLLQFHGRLRTSAVDPHSSAAAFRLVALILQASDSIFASAATVSADTTAGKISVALQALQSVCETMIGPLTKQLKQLRLRALGTMQPPIAMSTVRFIGAIYLAAAIEILDRCTLGELEELCLSAAIVLQNRGIAPASPARTIRDVESENTSFLSAPESVAAGSLERVVSRLHAPGRAASVPNANWFALDLLRAASPAPSARDRRAATVLSPGSLPPRRRVLVQRVARLPVLATFPPRPSGSSLPVLPTPNKHCGYRMNNASSRAKRFALQSLGDSPPFFPVQWTAHDASANMGSPKASTGITERFFATHIPHEGTFGDHSHLALCGLSRWACRIFRDSKSRSPTPRRSKGTGLRCTVQCVHSSLVQQLDFLKNVLKDPSSLYTELRMLPFQPHVPSPESEVEVCSSSTENELRRVACGSAVSLHGYPCVAFVFTLDTFLKRCIEGKPCRRSPRVLSGSFQLSHLVQLHRAMTDLRRFAGVEMQAVALAAAAETAAICYAADALRACQDTTHHYDQRREWQRHFVFLSEAIAYDSPSVFVRREALRALSSKNTTLKKSHSGKQRYCSVVQSHPISKAPSGGSLVSLQHLLQPSQHSSHTRTTLSLSHRPENSTKGIIYYSPGLHIDVDAELAHAKSRIATLEALRLSHVAGVS